MKKRILLFTAIAGMAVAMLTSGKNGAAAEKGYDCTGAETGLGNFAGCGGASGCHSTSATTGITVASELDSAGGYATTHYKGGVTYTVKITGTNTTATSYPKFGFQVSCITGATAVTTPTNAGTFASTGLPVDVRYTPAETTAPTDYFACNVVEHSDPITATTGSGGTGTTYVESFQWTAPVSGTGTISFWGALNAVGTDTTAADADAWNTVHVSVSEWSSATAVANVLDNINVTVANPVISNLNIRMDNAQAGVYAVRVFDITGRIVSSENITINSTSQIHSINTNNWSTGIYQLVLQKDGFSKTIRVVKR